MSAPKLAMIGTGNVGAGLGNRLLRCGYAVCFAVRNDDAADKARARVDEGAQLLPTLEAVAYADVVFLAVPGGVVVEAASGLGPLDGKILVDCTNPVRWDAGPVWSPPAAGSNAQAIAAAISGVRVVKAFNTFGAEFHADPRVDASTGADVPIAGDDAEAKQLLIEIGTRAGFRPFDMGPLRNAAVLENLAIAWIHLATVGGQGRDFVLQRVARSSS